MSCKLARESTNRETQPFECQYQQDCTYRDQSRCHHQMLWNQGVRALKATLHEDVTECSIYMQTFQIPENNDTDDSTGNSAQEGEGGQVQAELEGSEDSLKSVKN